MKLVGDSPLQKLHHYYTWLHLATPGGMQTLSKRGVKTRLIRIRWPAAAKVGVIGGQWRRLEDGSIEASYTPDQLESMLFMVGYDLTTE